MPELNWIGKEAVKNHLREVPTHLLVPHAELSCGTGEQSGNLIVEGDNLMALQALLPRYAGQVKCIYIDPPYNTGNEGWIYNDNVNAPEIKRWLGQTVGKDTEDLSRHDKWLCMMYPRLQLLKKFLSDDGAIFISIDDNEVASLRFLMDEIFGRENFIGNAIWEKSDSPRMDANFYSSRHDHTITYAKNIRVIVFNKLNDSVENIPTHYNRIDENGRKYYTKPLRAMGGQGDTKEARPTLHFAMTAPDGSLIYPKRKDGRDGAWRWNKEKTEQESQRIEWVKGKTTWTPYYRIYADNISGRPPETIWPHSEVGSNRTSKAELNSILTASNDLFATPKPTRLIQRILQIASDGPSLILDSFAGSGTTAHAVLKQNAEDGGTRKFILVEMEPKIARDITAERVRRVISGYTDSKGKPVAGLGGGFQYCSLSAEPLFQPGGAVRPDVTFAQLAEFVWFRETGTGYAGKTVDGPLVGIHEGRAVYLLFNGILKDRKVNGGNILTAPVLQVLPPFDGPRVIYAAGCRISPARLERAGITFKQTPYDLHL